ncbi:porin family protein [Flavobacterium sufflavum]|uniref:Porin family protein n=1 Tax=Flavobacterium sufflavum TaxID=1921138 RepID=A0A437KNT7_9FLAO|nr:outer membrane beta-barrel protein [Flavobacterium sufflavum]RVT73128.1 porin family protein [Flavobacterium sufflavum]
MKKIFLTISLAFFGIISAQTEKGSFIISGQTNLGFTSNTTKYKSDRQTTDGPKTNTFSISPSVGYFIVNNLALGLAFDYKSTITKQQIEIFDPNNTGGYTTGNIKETQTTLSIVPNATYFFSKGKTRPYFGAGLGLANTKYKSNYTSDSSSGDQFSYSENKNTGLVWTANGGLLFLITPAVSIDLGLGYANYSFKDNGLKTNSSAFGANAGISVFLN